MAYSNLTSITNNIIIVKLNKTTTGTLTIEVPYNGGGEKVTAFLLYGSLTTWFSFVTSTNTLTNLKNATLSGGIITITNADPFTHGVCLFSKRY